MQPIENDPSARIQFRRISELSLPGSCYVCGSGTCEEGYFDFGTFVDYHGHLYLCVECFMQAAAIINLITPEELMTQVGSMEMLLVQNEQLKTEVGMYREQLSNADSNLRRLLSGDPDSVISDVPLDESVIKTEPVTDSGDPNPFKGTDEGESESEEPVKGSERKRTTRVTALNVT